MKLIKYNTCFKGKGSCTSVILTNRKYSFKHTNPVEIGISDHHHSISQCLKQPFLKQNVIESQPVIETEAAIRGVL